MEAGAFVALASHARIPREWKEASFDFAKRREVEGQLTFSDGAQARMDDNRETANALRG